MVLNYVFLLIFILVISAVLVFLFCMFIPSLKTKYEGMSSFMFNGHKFAEKDLKIMWKIKHLPWSPELTIVSKKDGPQIEEHQDNKKSIWIKIHKLFGRSN